MFHVARRTWFPASAPFSHFRLFFSASRATPDHDAPGCFGIKGLHSPADWNRIAKSCADECLRLADQIRLETKQPSAVTLQLFDDLSDRLCSVLDVAELCRNVHPDPEFVRAASEAFSHVASVTQHLNADISLYEPLAILSDMQDSKAHRRGSSISELSVEDAIMVQSLKTDFERGGINLDARRKDRLLKLQAQAEKAGHAFLSPPSDSYNAIEIPRTKLFHIPTNLRESLRPRATESDNVVVRVDEGNAQLLLKWISDSKTREKIFRMTYEFGMKSKIDGLNALMQSRYDIAKLLGHDSYAELLFGDRLASSPEDVLGFLNSLSNLVQESALNEKQMLESEKMWREAGTTDGNLTTIHGWDRSYYIGRLKAREFDLSSTGLSQYFPLQSCLQGLAEVVSEAFGVRLQKVHPHDGELWHPRVEKYEVTTMASDLLGHIFFDLFPREGKYGHAAHFAIRCGRQPADQASYQTPVVALVCNFGRDTRDGVPLLSISDYETLFHEFGHSLHSLVSRTKYQHLSGTRVPMDFVEIPSHVFEHFAWDPRVLSRTARHYKTGDQMPTRLMKSLIASRNGFIATDVQMQILFAAMDLTYHGANPPVSNAIGAFEDLQRDLTVFEPDRGAAIPATFHHLVGYGAGYYSYIFARAVSAQIWSSLFHDNPFSKRGGQIFKDRFLVYGGSRDPSTLVRNVTQGPITCHSFLQHTNINFSSADGGLPLPLNG